MKTMLAMAAVSTFALGCQAAGAQEQKARLAACLDAGFADLMSAGSRDFTSPQYFLICDEAKTVEGTPGCKREEKRKSFTFEAPAGFRIDGARFSVVMKTPETSASELKSEGISASIGLQCRSRECGERGHVMIGGNIVGRLVYQPTVEDAKQVAGACLETLLQ